MFLTAVLTDEGDEGGWIRLVAVVVDEAADEGWLTLGEPAVDDCVWMSLFDWACRFDVTDDVWWMMPVDAPLCVLLVAVPPPPTTAGFDDDVYELRSWRLQKKRWVLFFSFSSFFSRFIDL